MIGARSIFLGRGGAKLPYDSEVEYIESKGYQWIDTGIRPAQDLSFAVVFNNLNIDFGYGNVFGSRLLSTDNEYQVTCYSGGSVGVGQRYSGLGFNTNVINTITYNGIDELNINGTVRQIVPQSCEKAVGNIVLFGINQNGMVFQLSKCRIYNVKFGNVRDFIPVRKGAIGYMYDRVSGQLFGNQGTGDFVVGPDVVEVEYLRHTGTQWIDTGYAMADSRKIDIRVNWSAHSTTSREMMGGGASGSYFVEVNANGYYALGASASTISSIKAEGTDNLTFAYNVGALPTLSVNGALATTDVNIHVPAGTFKTAISASFAPHCDLYALDIYTDNDEQTRRMLPVRVGTDATSWEGAMMDVLTRRIYRNAGTGAFGYGNDK